MNSKRNLRRAVIYTIVSIPPVFMYLAVFTGEAISASGVFSGLAFISIMHILFLVLASLAAES